MTRNKSSSGSEYGRKESFRSVLLLLVLWVFSHGIFFVLNGRFGERVWLWLLFFLLGIILDSWWLDRIVTGVAFLEAVAHVYRCALASLGDGDSAGPSERFNHVDSKRDILTFSCTISILLYIAHDFAEPAWLLSGEESMLSNVSKSLNCWILCL